MRNARTQQHATSLRKQLTESEQKLWFRVRRGQLEGFKFRRQVPIGPFIADFACIEAKLIVELDGGQHLEQAGRDAQRTRFLSERGFTVLRFWDDAVFKEMNAVLETIVQKLREANAPSLTLPRERGRERGVRHG